VRERYFRGVDKIRKIVRGREGRTGAEEELVIPMCCCINGFRE
jgi:hypothetical protein